jgi:hypothetical protein
LQRLPSLIAQRGRLVVLKERFEEAIGTLWSDVYACVARVLFERQKEKKRATVRRLTHTNTTYTQEVSAQQSACQHPTRNAAGVCCLCRGGARAPLCHFCSSAMQRRQHAAGSRRALYGGDAIAPPRRPFFRRAQQDGRATKVRAIDNNDDQCLYAVLGVPPHANAEQIKVAFKRKALELHPDQCSAVSLERFCFFAW